MIFPQSRPEDPEQIKKRIDEHWRCAQIPKRLQKARFDHLDKSEDLPAHEAAFEFAEQGEFCSKQGLVFLGKPGCGKTTLAVAAMRHALERSRGRMTVRYWNVVDGLYKIMEGFDGGAAKADLIPNVHNNQFVIVDDLGWGKWSDWVQNCLFRLIDNLYSFEKKLILTSNLSAEKFNDLEDRLISRLSSYEIIPMKGRDFRLDSPEPENNG